MRPLLDDIISPTQSAFVLGRLIMDNALIAFECLHSLNHGRWNCTTFGALKRDLTKEYDHVDWKFLESVLTRLAFQRLWV
jgi:hypothetical protein